MDRHDAAIAGGPEDSKERGPADAVGRVTVQLLGVRGSTPAPGEQFVRVGGHTSCLAVPPERRDGRWLVLDAGTGFTHLGSLLGDRPLRADIVLTHLHWDHVQGLPFLAQADRDDSEITLWIPSPDTRPVGHDVVARDAQALEQLAEAFSPPHFPIRPDGLRGRWAFRALGPGAHGPGAIEVDDRVVRVAEVRHKGGLTMGVRVTTADRSFAYLPDHAIGAASPDQLRVAVSLASAVDVLFHGAPYVERERATATAFGHSTVQDAVDLAVRARVGRLVLVHHAPRRSDDQIDRVLVEAEEHVRTLGSDLQVEIGQELGIVSV